MNLTQKQKDYLLDEATESLVGHMAMESVTGYVVRHINEKYNTEFEDTFQLVEFIQENNAEIEECPICGWYVDYLTSYTDEDNLEQEACEDCAQYN